MKYILAFVLTIFDSHCLDKFEPAQISAFAAIVALFLSLASIIATIWLILNNLEILRINAKSLAFSEKTFQEVYRPSIHVERMFIDGDPMQTAEGPIFSLGAILNNCGNRVGHFTSILFRVFVDGDEISSSEFEVQTLYSFLPELHLTIRSENCIKVDQYIDIRSGKKVLSTVIEILYFSDSGENYTTTLSTTYDHSKEQFKAQPT